MTGDFFDLLARLVEAGVDFVIESYNQTSILNSMAGFIL